MGEGLLLSQPTAVSEVGTEATITGTLQDTNGNPILGTQIDFSVIAGPHSGMNSSDTTDANGQATLTYTGSAPGTDEIQATFLGSSGLDSSNVVSKSWIASSAVHRHRGLHRNCRSSLRPVGRNRRLSCRERLRGDRPSELQARISIDLFDVAGRTVRSLERRNAAPGENLLIWDGRDARGAAVSSGVYSARYRAGEYRGACRITRLR